MPLDIVSPIILFLLNIQLHRRPVSESRASLTAFRLCSFDGNDCVVLFSENKYDDDDDDDDIPIRFPTLVR